MKKLLLRILCLLGNHDWTCRAIQGIKPRPGEVFSEYAITYCARCKVESPRSVLLRRL